MRGSWMTVLSLVALPVLLSAQDFPNPEFRDAAIIPYFQSANPEIVYFQTFYSEELDEQHTLLLVRGGAPRPGWNPAGLPMRSFWWTEGDLLGLFLMETADPSQVWQLAMIPNAPEYHEGRLEVDRVDQGSIVLRVFQSDYGLPAPWLKIFFDINSMQLLGQVRFDPVAFRQIAVLPRNRRLQRFFVGSFEENPVVAVWNDLSSGPVLVSEEERREVLRFLAQYPRRPFWGLSGEPLSVQTDDRDGSVTLLPIDSALPERPTRFFVSLRVSQGMRSVEGVAERTADGYKLYPFPRSTLEDHNRFRPERNERQGREFDWTIEEKIVHYQITDRFWFAKSFYDGEGYSGVGAIGYFDLERREYVLFSPPELAPWSASALVPGDVVWVGLVRQPEGAAYSGGLLRFEPATGSARVYEFKEIIHAILQFGPSSALIGTANGIYVLRDEQLQRFVIEPDLSGNPEIIAAAPPE